MTTSGQELPAIPDVLIDDAKIRDILLALKQIAEIREGRRGDVNQRFISYYELVDYLRGNDQITLIANTGGHNHDTLYSLLDHDHQGLYAEIVDVEGVYALVVHDHDGLYSALHHQHQGLYAEVTDVEGVYSLINHHHDGLYDPIGPRSWNKITANGVTLGGGPPTSTDVVDDLQEPHDGNSYTVVEIAGNAGQNLVIDFTNVISFSMVQVLMRAAETAGHALTIQLEVTPFDGSAWHTYDVVNDQVADQNFENHDFFVPDSSLYINSGVVKVRIVHEKAGTAADNWVIDTVGLYRQ